MRKGMGKGMGKGWRNESRRHSLARRGIKTKQNLNKIGMLAGKRFTNWNDLTEDERQYFIMVHNINNEKEFSKYLNQFGIRQKRRKDPKRKLITEDDVKGITIRMEEVEPTGLGA